MLIKWQVVWNEECWSGGIVLPSPLQESDLSVCVFSFRLVRLQDVSMFWLLRFRKFLLTAELHHEGKTKELQVTCSSNRTVWETCWETIIISGSCVWKSEFTNSCTESLSDTQIWSEAAVSADGCKNKRRLAARWPLMTRLTMMTCPIKRSSFCLSGSGRRWRPAAVRMHFLSSKWGASTVLQSGLASRASKTLWHRSFN